MVGGEATIREGTSSMTLFLGYDPGGQDRNGVAAAQISENHSIETLDAAVVRDAAEVLKWFSQYDKAACLGVDTLLAWSLTGGRDCDDWLRQTYKGRVGRSAVIAQNTLYSAMTLNGAMVAMEMKKARPSLMLCESHPKLQRAANLLPASVVERSAQLNDHAFDALVAAWCASRWHFHAWSLDLYQVGEDNLVFPAGPAVFPWPEAS
jgi:hypothetical protein